eukprot:INCI12336.1.p1 GENE.INCI12336.1~~INCI12336.1.p1  ORF type:complete len:542 (-),score=57.86 INCI12336.1:265-1890(-)
MRLSARGREDCALPADGEDDDDESCLVPVVPGASEGTTSDLLGSLQKNGAMPLEQALRAADASGVQHRRIAYVVLVATLSGGCSGATSPFILGPLSQQLSMSTLASGSLASSVFVGMWIGSFVGGILSDAFGPGRAMMVGVGLQAVGSVLPALFLPSSVAVFLVVLCRIIVGLGIVLCYQGGNTYLAEWLPTEVRGKYMSLLHFTISVGGLLTTALATVVPQENWQLLVLLNSIPTLAVLLFARFVSRYESPRWQLLNGRERQCLDMLRRVQAASGSTSGAKSPPLPTRLCLTVDNGSNASEGGESTRSGNDDNSTNASAPGRTAGEPARRSGMGLRDRLRQMSQGSMWRLLLVGTLVAFSLNFGSKGLETWSGVYVEKLGLPHLSRSIYFATLTGKVIGDFLNIKASEWVGRIRMLQYAFWTAGVALFCFVYTSSAPVLLMLACIVGIATDILWCCIYMYLTEIFPTSVRSTAFGLAMGIGRSGGVVSSGIGGAFESIRSPFQLYALSFLAGGLLVSLFTVETAHRPLADTVSGSKREDP